LATFSAFLPLERDIVRILGLLLISSVILVLACTGHRSVPMSNHTNLVGDSSCGSDINIPDALKRLTSDDELLREQTRKILVDYSRRSPACRLTIVRALIEQMDKPNLNFSLDSSSFLLWSEGSLLLGELKAEQGIDLLIKHLDLNDGLFSSSMSHQPAVPGLTKMGTVAIPKLTIALRSHQNRKIRLAAALCLLGIGGSSARDALKDALGSQSDECVTRFIGLSLAILEETSVSDAASSKLSDVDAETNLRRELLVAFRCNN